MAGISHTSSKSLCVALTLLGLGALQGAFAFIGSSPKSTRRHSPHSVRLKTKLLVSQTSDEIAGEMPVPNQVDDDKEIGESLNFQSINLIEENEQRRIGMPDLIRSIGEIDDDRIIHSELTTGEVPRLFSSLKYNKAEDGKVTAEHNAGSVVGATALVAGTTIGAGVLALPTATAAAGFLPSSAALGIAWVYMTMSGLLIAELTMNRIGTSGRPGLGLLELYKNSLGGNLARVGSGAYFFLHYAIMVAYIAHGGSNLDGFLTSMGLDNLASIPGMGQILFAGTCGAVLYAASSEMVEKINNVLVFGVVASFLGIVGLGSFTADFSTLIDPSLQHPEQVVNCFPILFLSLVYQNVVPTVVSQLEGDRSKITNSIIAGTSIPFLMFLAFNGVILANVLGNGAEFEVGVDPVSLLQNSESGGIIGNLVGSFSSLAVVTSLIGFVYGLLNAWTDTLNIPAESKEFDKWKIALYGLVFLPPVAMSVANPDIFYSALDYAGAFGVSTLFLVLPPLMVWRERYGEEKPPLATKPMGKSGRRFCPILPQKFI